MMIWNLKELVLTSAVLPLHAAKTESSGGKKDFVSGKTALFSVLQENKSYQVFPIVKENW